MLPPKPQAGLAGVPSPTIFRNDEFPPMDGFCFAVLDDGSSGNESLDSFGGGACLRGGDVTPVPGPALLESAAEEAIGAGATSFDDPRAEEEAELDVHGVLR
jgi:hypothetical protein